MKRVIAVCGFKQSGKDTIANYLCQDYGYTNIKIAEPLKVVCKYLFNVTDQQLEDHVLKETVDPVWGVTPRQLMQFVGTDMMQFKLKELIPSIDRLFWIKRLVKTYDINADSSTKLVISDLRFPHEHECLKNTYGSDLLVIKTIRKETHDINDLHPSEKEIELISPDVIIENNGTLSNLYQQIDQFMKTQ